MIVRSLCVVTCFLIMIVGTAYQSNAASRSEINAGVKTTLGKLYRKVPDSQRLAGQAAGVLVFPTVYKAGIGIGGEYGEGALLTKNKIVGYYNTASASIGLQLGAQAKSVVIMFMTKNALASFKRKDGWKVGVDGSVALITVGAGGSIDTNQIDSPVIGFVLGSKGLMYNFTLEGSKISRIDR